MLQSPPFVPQPAPVCVCVCNGSAYLAQVQCVMLLEAVLEGLVAVLASPSPFWMDAGAGLGNLFRGDGENRMGERGEKGNPGRSWGHLGS